MTYSWQKTFQLQHLIAINTIQSMCVAMIPILMLWTVLECICDRNHAQILRYVLFVMYVLIATLINVITLTQVWHRIP